MTSITRQVWKEIDKDVVIRRAIEKGIGSLKNISAYLIKEKGILAKADAVISAVRRYEAEQLLENKFEKARETITKSEDLKITTNIVELAIEKNKETQALLSKAHKAVSYEKGELFLMIQGEKSIKLIFNERNEKQIKELFSKSTIIHFEKDLAEINITLSKKAVQTPGILSTLSTELMLHDVNIIEVMSCVPEMLFFVKQKDVVKSYEILTQLCI